MRTTSKSLQAQTATSGIKVLHADFAYARIFRCFTIHFILCLCLHEKQNSSVVLCNTHKAWGCLYTTMSSTADIVLWGWDRTILCSPTCSAHLITVHPSSVDWWAQPLSPFDGWPRSRIHSFITSSSLSFGTSLWLRHAIFHQWTYQSDLKHSEACGVQGHPCA